MPKLFHLNVRLSNSLLNALIKCGDCSTAKIYFPKMKRSVETYGNLMNGLNKENRPWETLTIYNEMKDDGIEADVATYLSVIKALSDIGDYSKCRSVVREVPHCFLVDPQIQNALVDMWVSFSK